MGCEIEIFGKMKPLIFVLQKFLKRDVDNRNYL